MKVTTVAKLARAGDLRTRMRAIRDGQAAVRLAAVAAGLRTGLLDMLGERPTTAAALAERGGWSRLDLLEALLRVLASMGLVGRSGPRWQLTRRGAALLADDVARASYEGFSDYHTGLYDQIERQLGGGPGRRDVAEKGQVIARLSRAMDPFVTDLLSEVVRSRGPRRILDVGCATGSHLRHMLSVAPDATGVGVETDAAAAEMARETMDREGLGGRVRIVEADIRSVLDDELGRFDLALLANVVYYLPVEERVPLFRAVAGHLEPGGAVVVVTTVLTDAVFSRHFDLLLRTQEGDMGLPDLGALTAQLRQAGLSPAKPRRIAPGEPLTAVVATRP